MRCIHCGINIKYYSSIEHATTRSNCQVSHHNYHVFVSDFEYHTRNCFRSCYNSLKTKKWNVFGKMVKRQSNTVVLLDK